MNELYHPPQTKIAVIGLGYVGLPLAMSFLKKGFHVIGIDVNQDKIQQLKLGESDVATISQQDVYTYVRRAAFEVTTEFQKVQEAKASILCLPTPLTEQNTPDMTYIHQASTKIETYMPPQHLVVLESTTYPGTTEEVLLSTLEKNGKQLGADFYLGYSPERIDPGNTRYELERIPKVISGMTQACLHQVHQLYRHVFSTLVPVSSPRVAELSKLVENTQRYINISLMNEMTKVSYEMGIDMWEVLEAASTKPYGFVRYDPGPGIGGHCIPVDPLYLLWKSRQFQTDMTMIEAAKQINDTMPDYIVHRIDALLKLHHKNVQDSHILLVGMTYKKDVQDIRHSVSVPIFSQLLNICKKVEFHDSLAEKISMNGEEYRSVVLSPQVLQEVDCVVILTDHSYLPYEKLILYAPLILDTRHTIKDSHPHLEHL